MELQANELYHHEEHGDVVVLGVHHVYDAYDVTTESGELRAVVVRFTNSWDGYGPMPAAMLTEPVEEFTNAIGEVQGTVEFESAMEATE